MPFKTQNELKKEFREFLEGHEKAIGPDPLLPDRIERTIKNIKYIYEDRNGMVEIIWKE